MRPLRRLSWWLLLGLLLVVGLFYLSLDTPPALMRANHMDKVGHVGYYLLLSYWFGCILQPRRFWQLGAGLILIGALIEILQGLTPYRSMEFNDWLADSRGVLIGLGLAFSPMGQVMLWAERRMAYARTD
jgi:VanZ family protein